MHIGCGAYRFVWVRPCARWFIHSCSGDRRGFGVQQLRRDIITKPPKSGCTAYVHEFAVLLDSIRMHKAHCSSKDKREASQSQQARALPVASIARLDDCLMVETFATLQTFRSMQLICNVQAHSRIGIAKHRKRPFQGWQGSTASKEFFYMYCGLDRER